MDDKNTTYQSIRECLKEGIISPLQYKAIVLHMNPEASVEELKSIIDGQDHTTVRTPTESVKVPVEAATKFDVRPMEESRPSHDWVKPQDRTGTDEKDADKRKREMAERRERIRAAQVNRENRENRAAPSRKRKEANKLGKPISYYATVIFAIFASILIGVSVIYFVASNWERIGQIGKTVVVAVMVLMAVGVGYFAFKSNTRVWKECAAIFGTTIGFASFLLIVQIYNLNVTGEQEFLSKTVWIAVALAVLFNSRIMYSCTSVMLIICAETNEYSWWYIFTLWTAYGIYKVFTDTESGWTIVNLITQGALMSYMVFSVIENQGIVTGLTLMIMILMVYDRLYIWYTDRYSFTFLKWGAIGLFLLLIGPIYAEGSGEIETLLEVALIAVMSLGLYLGVTIAMARDKSNQYRTIVTPLGEFPCTATIAVSVSLGLLCSAVLPIFGTVVALLPVIIVFMYYGNRYSYNRYTVFSLVVMVYLVTLIFGMSEGDFGYRSILSAATGIVLLITNYLVKRYSDKEGVRVSAEQPDMVDNTDKNFDDWDE
jgi:uncharacterized membrane protein